MFDSDGLNADIKELIQFFGEKYGLSIFRSKTGDGHNPTTGAVVPTYDDSQAYMAGDEMMGGILASRYSQEYQQENMLVYVSGEDIPKPKAGDLVQPAWLTTSHKVIHGDGDMFTIAWILHVQRKAE